MAKLEDVKELNESFEDQGLLFSNYMGQPYGPSNLRRTRLMLCKEADVPVIPNHAMRKICCTLLTKELIKQGTWSPKIVADLMGHENVKVTIEVYVQVIEEDKNKAIVSI